jgi:uncharacterized protein YkwD
MRRFARYGQSGLLVLAVMTAPCVHADALSTVQMLRAGGCGGIFPTAPPLAHSTMLDRTAEQWATGTALNLATERAGYWPQSTTGLRMSGTDWSIVQQLRHAGCGTVLDRRLREVGVYRRGADSWLVLAWGYGVPVSAHPASAQPIAPAPLAPAATAAAPLAYTRPSTAAQAPFEARPPPLANRALELVNDVRARGARCGRRAFGPAPPLVLSGALGGVALGHAADMANRNYFEHEDLAGHSPADRVRAVGYKEKLVGENIAYGPGSIEEVVQGWLDSPGHCENIMDPRFTEMGIAYANGQSRSRHGLYWVQLLAEPRA